MSDNPPQIALSPEYHKAVGEITVNGAIMDNLVDHAIWLVLRIPRARGEAITKPILSTKRKIDLLDSLVKPMISDNALQKRYADVSGKLRSAQAHRSKVVHATWLFKEPSQAIYIEVGESDETQAAVEAMPLKKIQGYAREIAQAHAALEQFFLDVDMKPFQSGHHTWPPRSAGRRPKPKR